MRWVRKMAEEAKPLLFVRRASGLRRAITPWQSIFFGVSTSCTLPCTSI